MAKTKIIYGQGMYEITVRNPEYADKINLGDFVSIDGTREILHIANIKQNETSALAQYSARPIRITRLEDDFEIKILESPEKYGFVCKQLSTKKRPVQKDSY
jgi:hypothetical protein